MHVSSRVPRRLGRIDGAAMAHLFEPAASGRSKCRACGQALRRGELRFGERLPNLFGEGDMTLWFHPRCAAYKRPQPFLQALDATALAIPERAALEQIARAGAAHRRLPRIDGADRAPTGQARCRHCREPIERASWRIRVVFYEEGRFSPGGFVHLACREPYFETSDVVERLLDLSPALDAEERAELARACAIAS
jgi:hypothetical protein